MLKYIKFIVYDEYILKSKMCADKNLNKYILKCVKNVFLTINNEFILSRSDDNFYKTPVIKMATKYNPNTKSYSSHPNIDSVTEIILKKPALYITQSVLSLETLDMFRTPTSIGDANRIFVENKIPKWFYKELQRIFFPIINYWYVYCVFSFFYAILFINDLNIRNKNILFSIIPIYFGALISFFHLGKFLDKCCL